MGELSKYPPHIRQGLIIVRGHWLNDDHIEAFGQLLETVSNSRFEPRPPYHLQFPHAIKPVPEGQKHIQILFSCIKLHRSDAYGRPLPAEGGHWVCSYYDGNKIYIYDSLNRNLLHRHHLRFLRGLYPYYNFDQRNAVLFPLVDQQPNFDDCGVYSIAFAISIFYGLNPENIRYCKSKMRLHMLKIHLSGVLEHFPLDPIDPAVSTSLEQVKVGFNALVSDFEQEIDRAVKPLTVESSLSNSSSEPEQACQADINHTVQVESKVLARKAVTFADYLLNCNEERTNKKKKLRKKDVNQISSKVNSMTPKSNGNSMPSIIIPDVSEVSSGQMLGRKHGATDNEVRCEEKKCRLATTNQILISNSDENIETRVSQVSELNKLKIGNDGTESLMGKVSSKIDCNIKLISTVPNNLKDNKTITPSEIMSKIRRKATESQAKWRAKKRRIAVSSSDTIRASPLAPCTATTESLMGKVSLNIDRDIKSISTVPNNLKDNEIITPSDMVSKIRHKATESQAKWRAKKRRENSKEITFQEVSNKKFKAVELCQSVLSRKRKRSLDNSFEVFSIDDHDKSDFDEFLEKRLKCSTPTTSQITSIEKGHFTEDTADDLTQTDALHSKIIAENHKKKERRKRKMFGTLISDKTKSKGSKISQCNDWVQTRYTLERYIRNLMASLQNASPVASRLEAERIVKWCFIVRKKYILRLKNVLSKCTQMAQVCLTRSAEVLSLSLSEQIQTFCGQSLHKASSEAYFAESSYHTFRQSEPIVMDTEGKAVNILPLVKSKSKTQKSWYCGSSCRTDDTEVLMKLKVFCQRLMSCSLSEVDSFSSIATSCTNKVNPDKLGHSYGCYTNVRECLSTFLSVQILAPHFPRMRTLRRRVYDLILCNKKLQNVDSALNDNDIDILKKIADDAQKKADACKGNTAEINLNKREIRANFKWAFRTFTKRSIDTPRFPCVSCEKLCTERDILKIDFSKVSKYGEIWKTFIDCLHTFSPDFDQVNYICRYCDGKFAKNDMPPRCIANDLYVRPVPPFMKSLNIYEKILIQRAKAFQVVQQLAPVTKTNQPRRHMVPKVVGRTFHLPLPMDETLKKVCPSTDPIYAEHELYILIRGVPTKSKVIWEQLVDLRKVWLTLQWLQQNNPLYLGIELPKSHENLLPHNLQQVQYEETPVDDMNLDKDSSSNLGEKKNALLTQMSQSDEYYENFSIYPIHDKRTNKSATDLYQMLKVYERAFDYKEQHLDLKCFPDLYPYGENGQHEPRRYRITDFEFIKSRLMSKHSQFRMNEQYLFFLLHNNNMRQLNAGIYHKLNITNPRSKYTAASYLDEMSKGLLESNLNTIFSRLRNTEQFWVKPRSDLQCMIRAYGPATWFLTFSPSEWLWGDLVEYLRDVNNIPVEKKVSPMQLIVSDPVSTSRFMDIKFKAMLDFIRSPDNPIGQVVHHFWRREYQTRGAPHFHLLLWIKDAPVIGKSSETEIAEFILKYVTCRMPDKTVSPELYRRVNAHQIHHHNSYCLRTKKTKTGFTRRCKFGHPRPLTDVIKLRDVSVSIAGRKQLKTRSRLYDLPRSSAEACVNDYNPAILCAWEGNMDLQFIGESSTLLTHYVTKYLNKTEKSNTVNVLDIINSTKSVFSCLYNIAMRQLNNRECGAFEAADSLLGIGLHGTDPETTIKWVDVNMIRSRRIKPRKEIDGLQPESTDIFYASIVDTHYPNRPKELETTNLYDFVKWYDITNTNPKTIAEVYKIGEKYLKRRSRGCLVNHRMYNIKTQPEAYYYSILLLFYPWREIDKIKGKYDTYAEAFASVQSQIEDGLRYHEKISEIQRAKDFVEEEVAKHLNSSEKENELCDDQILECVPVEVAGAMKDFKDVETKLDDNNLSEMIKELNSDQKRIFHTVTNVLQSEGQILRQYVSGEGGTGKSFLIKILRLWTKEVLGKDTAVTAPTGIAAFNVNGLTIHRLFQLPVEHGRTAKYRQLSDAVLKLLRSELRNVSLIIIDEVSMISNITLMYIHLRLSEIFNTSDSEDGWFGKRHMILFGDLLQLPPVHEDPPFIALPTKRISELIGAMGSVDLWTNLFTYDELTINMRQKGDHTYKDILSRIRLGVVLDSDTKVLETRKLQFNSIQIEDRLKEICDYMGKLPLDTVCLLPTCALCDILNTAMLDRISSPEIQLIAQDTIECAPYLKKKVSKMLCNDEEHNSRTAGVSQVITVKVGAQIMIRRNIDVTLGLVNGTIATIVSIRRAVDTNHVESINILLPSKVQHTLERVSVKFEIMDRAFIVRQQFPICLSYGMTIHKSQGLSLKNALIDAGNSIFSVGQTYVALSRVTKLDGLHLINYDPGSVKANEFAIIEYNRLRQKYRPELDSFNVAERHGKKTFDTVWSVAARILDCQEKPQSHLHKTIPSVRGLQNIDNVSCYAISTMQCILNCSPIRNAILIDPDSGIIRSFVKAYTAANTDDSDKLDILKVRDFLGGIFAEKNQQDAGEFINSLCERVCSIRSMVHHQISTVTICRACDTENTYPSVPNNVFLLSVPTGSKKSISLQEIIDDNTINWKCMEAICNNCNKSPVLQRTKILSTQSVVIIQLLLFSNKNGQVQKESCNIKDIPNTTVKIAGENYNVKSAIFHHGTSVENGHYSSMLRIKKTLWICANDSRIENRRWPRNGKDVYILFLEKI